MAYTVAAFVSALSGLSITGVTRMYAFPPESVNNADLPIAYVRLPESSNEAISLTSATGTDAVMGELVVLVRADNLSMNTTNFAAMVTLIDNINAALKTAAAASNRFDRWTIRQESALVGDAGYWAIVASVEASG